MLSFISLGSNVGDCEHILKEAIIRLHDHPSIRVVYCSSMYETEPVGYVEQANFINMVIALKVECTPAELFAHMVEIERDLGRTRVIKWGPRTIDLDLLLFEDVELETKDLIVPHPRMNERAFVLVPLVEIIESGDLSGYEDVTMNLDKLDGKDKVELWKKTNWHKELGRFES